MRLSGTEARAAEVLGAIGADWETARAWVYTAVLVATFLSGWVPLLASVVTALAMVGANVFLIRRPLRWLPPLPRASTKLASRLWFVLLLFASFAVNLVFAPLIAAWGLGAVGSALVGFATTYLYIEGSLAMVRGSVRRAAREG